jgi:hypothetical protein
MKRRSFLRGAALGTAAVASSGWFASAWAAPSNGTLRIFDAYRRARRLQRALLVFVVPVDPALRYERGDSLGAYLNHGTDRQLAPLALCEVVCATMVELSELSPATYDTEPSFVLIESVSLPAKPRHSSVTLKATTDYANGYANVDENISRIANAIAAVVLPGNQVSQSMLGHRDSEAEKALLPTLVNTPDKRDLSKIDRHAAGLMSVALKVKGEVRVAIFAGLAASARARIRDKPLPGARWAHASGCGPTSYEDQPEDTNVGYLCGMGHVPAKSERFLAFLVDHPK